MLPDPFSSALVNDRLLIAFKSGEIDIRNPTDLIVISIDFSYSHNPASRGFLSCPLYFWSFYGRFICSLLKTALQYCENTSRKKIRTLLLYFHSFCTSVFPTSNLMSSQMPIFH